MRRSRLDHAAVLRDAIRTCLDDAPGSTVREIARDLGVRDARVRETVAVDPSIRAVLTPGLGGKARRLYLSCPSFESRSHSTGAGS